MSAEKEFTAAVNTYFETFQNTILEIENEDSHKEILKLVVSGIYKELNALTEYLSERKLMEEPQIGSSAAHLNILMGLLLAISRDFDLTPFTVKCHLIAELDHYRDIFNRLK